MGDGTEQNPYTREDVIKAIEENGRTAKGLDLSCKVFEEGIDLRKFILRGIILKKAKLLDAHLEKANLWEANLEKAELFDAHLKGAYLEGANLKGAYLSGASLEGAYLEHAHLEGADLTEAELGEANLMYAHLEKAFLEKAHLEKATLRYAHLEEANLSGVYLQEADLTEAHLEEADLRGAHLEGAYFYGTKFSPDTRLELVDWGNYILGCEKDGLFDMATYTYRRLKQWYTNAGIYDTAGEFFYREMETKRKAMKWWPDPFPRAWSTFLALLVGYGERPLRVLASAMAAFLSLTAIYWLVGGLTLSYSLYFSAISFTALGYGNWVKDVDITGWMQGVGAFESFIGILMIVLFSITFTRKMIR